MSRPTFAKMESPVNSPRVALGVAKRRRGPRSRCAGEGPRRAVVARSSGLFGQGVGEVIIVTFGPRSNFFGGV